MLISLSSSDSLYRKDEMLEISHSPVSSVIMCRQDSCRLYLCLKYTTAYAHSLIFDLPEEESIVNLYHLLTIAPAAYGGDMQHHLVVRICNLDGRVPKLTHLHARYIGVGLHGERIRLHCWYGKDLEPISYFERCPR